VFGFPAVKRLAALAKTEEEKQLIEYATQEIGAGSQKVRILPRDYDLAKAMLSGGDESKSPYEFREYEK